MRKLTQEDFIRRATEIHGDKYDYTPTEYINSRCKVTIICPIHGPFTQKAMSHLIGNGCDECAKEYRHNLLRHSTEDFIAKARLVHGDKYDYTPTQYKGSTEEVEINCPIHGPFKQKAANHLSGYGCQKCKMDNKKNLILGVGVNDVYGADGSWYYQKWLGMLERCYDSKFQSKSPTYIGCSVCEEWHLLSNFAKWATDPANGYREGYHIDKDILVKGNKVYSPDTCCFVPPKINGLFTNPIRVQKGSVVGVRKHFSRYECRFKGEIIGYFDSEESASMAYKNAKKQYVIVLCKEYFEKGLITEKVYQAVLNYEI